MIDFTDFHEKGKKPQSKVGAQVVQRWWEVDDADLASAVLASVGTIIQQDRPRIDYYNQFSWMYGNKAPTIWNHFQIGQINTISPKIRERIAFNVIQSVIDTLTSKICKNKPKPSFLTSKGDTKVQRKAKKLDQFCQGIFYENKFYEVAPMIFRDAAIFGEGILHVYNDHGRVKYERVLPYELFTDYLECHYGPEYCKTLHRVKNFDRQTLLAFFPEHRDIIEKMGSTNDLLAGTNKSVADTVTVIESWRLPSQPGANDGLHTICAWDQLLLKEQYSKTHFPFAIIRNSPKVHGFWGQGCAERLVPIQTELNRCLVTVQRSYHLAGTFKVLLQAGSKVVKSHVDNTIGAIIEYAGPNPPQYITPPIVPPEIYQQIQNLKQMAYEQEGISQLTAQSQKPAGLNSGEALRTYSDIESDRFQVLGQAYENWVLDVARLTVEQAREIYEQHGNFDIKVPGKRFIETIKWKEVDLDDDEFCLQVFPVSKLPNDPAGRLEKIQEMLQAGMIDVATGRRLLDYPDLDAEENLANASLDYLHEVLDDIVEHGKYTQPEPLDDLGTALKLALEYYHVGKRDNLPEDRLELLRTYIDQVGALMATVPPTAPIQQAQQQAPQTPAQGPAPQQPQLQAIQGGAGQ